MKERWKHVPEDALPDKSAAAKVAEIGIKVRNHQCLLEICIYILGGSLTF